MFRFKSLSSRLIFYVTLSVLAIFSIVAGIVLLVQNGLVLWLFMVATSWDVDSKASAVDKRLAEVQTTILSHDFRVMNSIKSPNKMKSVFQDILYNHNIRACGIALKPDAATGNRYLLYATRDSLGKVTMTQRPNDYAYEEQDYFKESESRMTAYWSNPYQDGALQVATFSRPLADEEGRFVGVLCADVLLDSIASYITTAPGTSNSTMLSSIIKLLCNNAPSFILSRSGYFVVPPDSTVNMNDTYATYALRHQSVEFKQMGEAMVNRTKAQERLNETIKIDDKEYRLAYSYINKVGWTVATLYPTYYVDVFLTSFGCGIILMMLIGVMMLTFIIYMIVRRATKPLQRLVAASQHISQGNFDIELPKARQTDEVQMLRDSFEDMRLSLKDYVARLKDTTARNERMEQELNIASQIQMSMLPVSFPHPPEVQEVSVYAYLKPARMVGGDLYDFFIRDGHLHFVIGDVSGKGMPAAIIMAMTTSMFRALQRRDLAPERTVNGLNNMLLESNSAEMFVTLIVGSLNLVTGELSLCNAGHTPPILMQGGTQQYMKLHTNIPIGVFPSYHYVSDNITLSQGAHLLLYTDGVTEAVGRNEEMFGEERLMASACKSGGMNVESFINTLVEELNTFIDGAPLSDDITTLMLEYHGSQTVVAREMKFANDMKEVSRATALVEEICEKLHLDMVLVSSLQLALEEAIVNVISYAYENGRANIDNQLTITSDGKSITFVLSDCGMPFDPTKAAMPDITLGIEERGVGGLGILLVKNIMDNVTYKRFNNRNILIMEKKIAN